MVRPVMPEVCDPNSDASLEALIGLASSYAGYTERDARPLVEYVGRLKSKDWKRRLNGEPKTWERFCLEQLGYAADYFQEIGDGVAVLQKAGSVNPTIAEARTVVARAQQATPLLDVGRPERGEVKNVKNINISSRGPTAEYLTARIARDRPDILDRMKAGEFSSVRQAAIEAGIVKPPTAYDLLCRAWNKASKKEKARFMDEKNQEGW